MHEINKKQAKAVQITDPEIVRRLLYYVAYDPSTQCWIWTGYRDYKGYGQVKYAGRAHWVHRVAYAAFIGPIPDRLQIDHVCCNASCCNPAHLEAVTPQENRTRQLERAKHARGDDHDPIPI